MKRFNINNILQADCTVSPTALSGTLYHVQRNASGGALLTPIALYFVTQPVFVEGFNKHWRLDYFGRPHKLAPDSAFAGDALALALMKEGLCSEPLWLSVHRSEELEGRAYGQVFEIEPPADI